MSVAEKVVYTRPIDEFYDYRFGRLQYHTVRFEQETLDVPNFQGNAVVNYTEREVPYTRIIEHKHFESFGQTVYDNPKTVISKEYSVEFKEGMEPYYPVNDEKTQHYTINTRLWPNGRKMSFSADAWQNTNITTWHQR